MAEAAKGSLDADVVFVGGGLASTLAALRLADERPDVRTLILERGQVLGGDNTWSFHDSDVDPEQKRWLAPLISASWPDQEVRFPGFVRRLAVGYNTVTGAHLHEVACRRLGAVRLGAEVIDLAPQAAHLADGTRVTASCVIDATGQPDGAGLALAYQKFLGLEVRLAAPHGLDRPVIMDATVEQRDGYRFVYLLPFAPDRLLVEDTRYADAPVLDRAALERDVRDYIAGAGWSVAEVLRSEASVLPVVLDGEIGAFWDRNPGQPRAGVAAGLFHPTTSYSFPDAVALADRLAARTTFEATAVAADIRDHAAALWRRRAFYRMLNRMLFHAADPPLRRAVFERFYRLPAGLIARFYAGRLTAADKARLLLGRPPVPLGRAIAALPRASAWHP